MNENNYLSPPKNKKNLIKFVIICIVIFVGYNIWSHFNNQSLLIKSQDVAFFTDKIKSEHPKCSKINHIDSSVSYGDVTEYTYTFQLDQSSGCEYKTIQFHKDFSGFNEFTDGIEFR